MNILLAPTATRQQAINYLVVIGSRLSSSFDRQDIEGIINRMSNALQTLGATDNEILLAVKELDRD